MRRALLTGSSGGGNEMAALPEGGPTRPRSALRWLPREVNLAWRITAHNMMIVGPTSVLFSIAAGVHHDLPVGELLAGLGEATVLGLLSVYLLDSSNQVRSGEEDALNKPNRPIPAGLLTPAGMARRAWTSMAIYILLGWLWGVLPLVLLWSVAVIWNSRFAPPRYYLWWKTPQNIVATFVMCTTAWQVTGPLDATAWTWIVTITLYFCFSLIYEDVRDMDGDRAIGRRTPALVFGPTFVRYWFATFMVLLPGVVYFVLVRSSDVDDWRGWVSVGVVGTLSWYCAARALWRQGPAADGLTYQLFSFTWAVTCATAPLLLA